MSVICVIGGDVEGKGWWPSEGETVSYPLAVSRAWVLDALTVTAVKDTPTSIPGTLDPLIPLCRIFP